MTVVGRSGLVVGVFLAFGFASCGEGDGGDDSGAGGTGGTAPNTCPPTLINYGSGPGIICEEPPGSICSDTEQFCLCGQSGIEGAPWLCVPTSEGCPPTPRPGEPCNANDPEECNYTDGTDRSTCTCLSSGVWSCAVSLCPDTYPGTGRVCTEPDLTCEFFRPGIPGNPEYAGNVPCTCTSGLTWSCD